MRTSVILVLMLFATQASVAGIEHRDLLDDVRYSFDSAIRTVVDIYGDEVAAAADAHIRSNATRNVSADVSYEALLSAANGKSTRSGAALIPPEVAAATEVARSRALDSFRRVVERYDTALRHLAPKSPEVKAYAEIEAERFRLVKQREDGSFLEQLPSLADVLILSQAFTTYRSNNRYVVVDLLYATDRKESGSKEPAKFYTARQGQLQYGRAEVTIPHCHKPGVLESPSWLKFEFSESSRKHVMLRSVVPHAEADMVRALRAVASKESGPDDVLLFIHGYGVTFDLAARRTAQVAYDIEFPGRVMFYSWPSKGVCSAFGYRKDEEMAINTRPNLRYFMGMLAAEVPDHARIHVLAHSMGTRPACVALMEMAPKEIDRKFDQLVLAAADIETGIFEERVIPELRPKIRRLTVYASGTDKALHFSAGLNHERRVGLAGPDLFVSAHAETVDVTGADDHLFTTGHAYYGKSREVLRDLGLIFLKQLPAPARLLPERRRNDMTYWFIGAK
jgi:esterase/lipase superfamily enzyme